MLIDVGQHTHVQATANAASATTPAIASAATGSTFVEAWTWANGTFSSVQDSKSNVYTQIQATVTASGGVKTGWWYKENGIGGASHTATINFSVNGTATGYLVEITGGATLNIKDQDVAGLEDLASPFTTNTTGTTSQANELALAFYSTATPSGTETITWGNGFSQIDADGNSSFVTGGIAKKALSAAGTVQGSITSSVATSAVGFVATFIAAADGVGAIKILNQGARRNPGSAGNIMRAFFQPQQAFIISLPTTVVFRKTLSGIGTGTGKRQTHGDN